MELRDDIERILLDGIPLLDVRAPVEFARGAFPGAVNQPLLDDDQRARVGTTYKRKGPDAAMALGHDLVSGTLKARRIEGWRAFAQAHPEGALYCFRGGQRSALVQRWLADGGIRYPRITGGYKAMRQQVMRAIAELSENSELILLAGRTGVGKTDVLLRLPAAVDLEGHANHRGSTFGRRPGGQPGVIDFEHRLGIDWMRLAATGRQRVIMEDESRCIGACALPLPLWEAFQKAPLVILHDTLAARVGRTRLHYVEGLLDEFCDAGFGFDHFADHLRAALERIRRRLGGARHAALREELETALTRHREDGDRTHHEAWIEPLLRDYYDPMYDYQIGTRRARVVFEGGAEAVVDWLAERVAIPDSSA